MRKADQNRGAGDRVAKRIHIQLFPLQRQFGRLLVMLDICTIILHRPWRIHVFIPQVPLKAEHLLPAIVVVIYRLFANDSKLYHGILKV